MKPRPSDAGAAGRLPAGASAIEVAGALGLEPHTEGGFFRETYRSPATVRTAAGRRPLSTAILYLLTADDPSRFHRLLFDEMWFFHAGATAELALLDPRAALDPDGERRPPEATGRAPEGGAHRQRKAGRPPELHLLGPGRPQVLAPAGRWLGARMVPEEAGGEAHAWTLVGCVVTPGFEYEDLEIAGRETLLRDFPGAVEIVLQLT